MEMGKGENLKRRKLMMMMEVLSHGRKLAKQLQNHLEPSAPRETRDYLIGEILSTYSKALHLANSQPYDSFQITDQISFQRSGNATSDYHSPGGSISHCSDSSDQVEIDQRRPSKKRRKTLPRWVKKVKVESEAEQGPLNDGYNWRKYGQKDIHGAAFPRCFTHTPGVPTAPCPGSSWRRGYYRCSHLHSQGCIATKQLQKSDEDPTVFHVIYRGHHTCTHSSSAQTPPPVPHPIKPDPAGDQGAATALVEPPLKVEAQGLETAAAPESFFFRCFSFSTAPFLEAAAGEVAKDWFISDASPATTDSNLLRSASSGTNAGGCAGVWTPESEFNEQGTSSATNSPLPDWPEFTLEELGIDPDFSFDNPELFS